MDRDGTIIRQVEFLSKASQVRLLPDAPRAITILNRLGYRIIVITNQPVIARGMVTLREVDDLHALLIARLKKKGAVIDAVYFCPHHPNATLKKYRVVCACRKPAPGMILQAAREHGIDLKKSFFIGDSTRDVLAGNRAKVKMILVKTGKGGNDQWQYKGTPDFIAKDLLAAARIIKKHTQITS